MPAPSTQAWVFLPFLLHPGRQLTPLFPCSPLMLSDSSSAHSVPKYARQYSLERVHGPGSYSVCI